MATNIFPCRESIWYSEIPKSRYGWHVSTSSDGRSIHYLDSRYSREELVKLVLQQMKKAGFEPLHMSGYPGEIEACFVLTQIIGGDDKDWFHEILTDMAPDKTELWQFLMDLAGTEKVREITNR